MGASPEDSQELAKKFNVSKDQLEFGLTDMYFVCAVKNVVSYFRLKSH